MHVPRRVDKVRQSEAAPLSLGQQLVLHKQQVSCGYGSYGLSTSPQGVALTVALSGPTGFMATARAVAGEVRRWQIRLLTSLVNRFDRADPDLGRNDHTTCGADGHSGVAGGVAFVSPQQILREA